MSRLSIIEIDFGSLEYSLISRATLVVQKSLIDCDLFSIFLLRPPYNNYLEIPRKIDFLPFLCLNYGHRKELKWMDLRLSLDRSNLLCPVSYVVSRITQQEQLDSGISVQKLPESHLAIKEEDYRPNPN